MNMEIEMDLEMNMVMDRETKRNLDMGMMMIIMLMMMTSKRRLTVMMKWSREESQVFNPTGNCRGLNGRFCLCLRLCLYICLCVHHVHVKASPWVKTISIQPAFSVFISIIIDWHCVTLWLSWAGNREWEIMYSNRREIMSSYGAISKWPSGKWLPRSQKWMKKNSDKFHSPSDMLFRRFGGFRDPGDQSSQWKINSPKNFHAQGGRRISLYFLRYEIEIRLRAVYYS